MADEPVLLTLPIWDQASAARRIAQLETALARRSDQLDELQGTLAELHESHAFRFAQTR